MNRAHHAHPSLCSHRGVKPPVAILKYVATSLFAPHENSEANLNRVEADMLQMSEGAGVGGGVCG